MRALVADDDRAMRDLMEAVLVGTGHDVVTAADGNEAWAHWEREPFPLLLLDWQMPGMTGLELCARVRGSAAGRETFILMATARGATDDLLRLLDAGADDYVSKPLTPELLHTRLVIAERRLASDRARRQAEEELARARWLAGIGETALAVQHEVNNPLAALLGNAQLLSGGLVRPDEWPALLAVVAEQAERIAAVVRRLGDLRDPRSVPYVGQSRMLDLSSDESGER